MGTKDKTVVVRTINEFLNAIFEIEDSNPENGENKQEYLYRGQGSKEWELVPSIARGKDNSVGRMLFNQEQHLIETAKHKIPYVFKETLFPIDLLALLQHYGIPTRLLDVTKNPLVALFFACEINMLDGEVIVFNHDADDVPNYALANAIADTYRLMHLRTNRLDTYFEIVSEQPYFLGESKKMQQCSLWKNGAEWIEKECKNTLIFVDAQEQLERQKLQQGRFIVFPNRIIVDQYDKKKYFDFEGVEPIDKDGNHIKRRIIIPEKEKQKIKERLELLGICEGTLFMDSVDSVCRQITSEARKRITYPHAWG